MSWCPRGSGGSAAGERGVVLVFGIICGLLAAATFRSDTPSSCVSVPPPLASTSPHGRVPSVPIILANNLATYLMTCPANHYCPSATSSPIACPPDTMSAAGSASVTQCMSLGPVQLPDRMIVVPTLSANGLNNQLMNLHGVVLIAGQQRATFCVPMVFTYGIDLRPRSLCQSWVKPFSYMYDEQHFIQCVAKHYNVRAATNVWEKRICEYGYAGVRDGLANNEFPHPTRYTPLPQIPNITAEEMTAMIGMRPQFWETFQKHGQRIALPDSYSGDMGIGPDGKVRGDNMHEAGLLAHGCIKPVSRIQTLIDRFIDAIKETQRNNGNAPIIGWHYRMEGDMKCAPSREWIRDRFCDKQMMVPCSQAICVVATGLRLDEYRDFLPCKVLITKQQILGDALDRLEREELALIDLMAMVHPVIDIFIGCGRSTFSVMVWGARKTANHPGASLEYGIPYIAITPPQCFPGNKRWIDDHKLTDVSCAADDLVAEKQPEKKS